MKSSMIWMMLVVLIGQISWAKCVSTPEELVADADFAQVHHLADRQMYATTDGQTYLQWWKGPTTGKLMLAFKYTGWGATEAISSFQVCKINGKYSMWVDNSGMRLQLNPQQDGIRIDYSSYSGVFKAAGDSTREQFGFGKPPKWQPNLVAQQPAPVQAQPTIEVPAVQAPQNNNNDPFDLGGLN